MPELPEVQTVVNTLRDHVVGQTIVAVPYVRTDMLTPEGFDLPSVLAERRIISLHRRAKRIVFGFDDRTYLFVHLGMTGQLTLEQAETARKPHTHWVVLLADGRELRLADPRRFGGIVWMGLAADHAGIGPEPLTLRTHTLRRQLARTKRAIKSALLDQRLIAGIGNIYADEALFHAGIHPGRRADTLNEVEVRRLNHALKHVLRRAILAGGSSIRDYVNARGERGNYQAAHKVYGRERTPCDTCKTPILRIVLGGRSTHFCPRCQAASVDSLKSK